MVVGEMFRKIKDPTKDDVQKLVAEKVGETLAKRITSFVFGRQFGWLMVSGKRGKWRTMVAEAKHHWAGRWLYIALTPHNTNLVGDGSAQIIVEEGPARKRSIMWDVAEERFVLLHTRQMERARRYLANRGIPGDLLTGRYASRILTLGKEYIIVVTTEGQSTIGRLVTQNGSAMLVLANWPEATKQEILASQQSIERISYQLGLEPSYATVAAVLDGNATDEMLAKINEALVSQRVLAALAG